MGLRAYHRVDPLMDERKSHYTPAQLGAYVKVQLVAGRQARRGTFRSLDAVTGALPTAYVRHVGFLVAEGDLVVRLDGSVYVDGWDEWQEGDLTVRDRMQRLRERKRHVTPSVTHPVTPQPSHDRNGHRNGRRNSTVTAPSPTATRSSVGVSTHVERGLTRPSTTTGAGAVEGPVDPTEGTDPTETKPWE